MGIETLVVIVSENVTSAKSCSIRYYLADDDSLVDYVDISCSTPFFVS